MAVRNDDNRKADGMVLWEVLGEILWEDLSEILRKV